MGDAVTEIVALFDGPAAAALYDEAVTELDHALQTAALAVASEADDALVAAALLHDVGHLVVEDLFPIDQELPRDFHHERVGATRLARWFGPEVCEPVRLHVAAKRYLVATDADYAAYLSPSSVRSLAAQGGPMPDAEVEAFAGQRFSFDAVALRRWDDEAKVADLDVPGLDAYVPLLERLAHDDHD